MAALVNSQVLALVKIARSLAAIFVRYKIKEKSNIPSADYIPFAGQKIDFLLHIWTVYTFKNISLNAYEKIPKIGEV